MLKAASVGLGDVVATLIDEGCDADVVDSNGRNLLQVAMDCKKKWVIDLIKKRFPRMEAATGKSREYLDRTSGQMRRDVERHIEHPQGQRSGKAKRGYEPDQSTASDSHPQPRCKKQRVGRKGSDNTT